MAATKGNGLAATKSQPAETNTIEISRLNSKPQICLSGTENPRQLRAINTLLRRPISRQELDSVAGCANGPALVSDLRGLGLTINSDCIKFIDRDGIACRPGVCSFTSCDRRKVHQWLNKRKNGDAV